MLKIRKQQEETLRQETREYFEDFLAGYLCQCYPQEYDAQNPGEAFDLVHYCIGVAASYGISSETNMFAYLNLMLFLGEDFDQDPALPWAREILLDETLNEDEAVARLVDHASPDDEPDVTGPVG